MGYWSKLALPMLLVVAMASATTQAVPARSDLDEHSYGHRHVPAKAPENDGRSYRQQHPDERAPDSDDHGYGQHHIDADDRGYGERYIDADDQNYGHRRISAREINEIDFVVALALGAGGYLLLRRRVRLTH